MTSSQPKPSDAEWANLRQLVAMAKKEDFASGDVTALLLPEENTTEAKFVAREELVLCGGAFLAEIAAAYDHNKSIETEVLAPDGATLAEGEAIAIWRGPSRSIVSAERVALNFLQRLSGIATLTQRYVKEVTGTSACVLDTRKTTPGWREIEKYAVRCGGGCNHRRGLYDAVLVKDNHLAALKTSPGGISARLDEIRTMLPPQGFVEVEVDTLEQLAEALKLDLDVILLDNMGPEKLRKAVAMRNETAPNIQLEASGGITLQTLRDAAETGVERISVGAITHSATAVDIGLDTM